MFTLNKVFIAILVASLAVVSCKSSAIEVTDVERTIVDSNPAQIAVLTQLKSTKSDSDDDIYNFKCTVGDANYANNLACTANDSTSWYTPHDVVLTLRCPKSGSGLTMSYLEIFYSVSSPSVNCFVSEGAVGLGYVGVTIRAWSTKIFNYSGYFYSS